MWCPGQSCPALLTFLSKLHWMESGKWRSLLLHPSAVSRIDEWADCWTISIGWLYHIIRSPAVRILTSIRRVAEETETIWSIWCSLRNALSCIGLRYLFYVFFSVRMILINVVWEVWYDASVDHCRCIVSLRITRCRCQVHMPRMTINVTKVLHTIWGFLWVTRENYSAWGCSIYWWIKVENCQWFHGDPYVSFWFFIEVCVKLSTNWRSTWL